MELSKKDFEFIADYDPSLYERPSVTADTALFRIQSGESGKNYRAHRLQLLLIRRGQPPYEGGWALPGGFCDMNESLDAAAARELYEETGLEADFYGQVVTLHAPDRDPRTRTFSTVYLAILNAEQSHQAIAGDDAAEAAWFDVTMTTTPYEESRVRVDLQLEGPESLAGRIDFEPTHGGLWKRTAKDLEANIAFDHVEAIAASVESLRQYLYLTDLPYRFLPPTFPLADLQGVFEAIVGEPLLRTTLFEHIKKRLRPVDDDSGEHVLERNFMANPDFRPPEGSLYVNLWRS